MLSEEKIKWREVNKAHLIGYDVDNNIGVEIIRDINTNSIIVKLEKDRQNEFWNSFVSNRSNSLYYR